MATILDVCGAAGCEYKNDEDAFPELYDLIECGLIINEAALLEVCMAIGVSMREYRWCALSVELIINLAVL